MDNDNSNNKKKKSSSSQRNPRASSTKRFGGLELSGGEASHLIGRIVEKGISDEPRAKPYLSPIPPPKPSVLPFPVARHRAHGPHWAPIGSEVSSGHGEDGDGGLSDEEDKAFVNFDPISAFANPVKRRNRKDMDFSSWKEILSGNNTSVMAEKPEGTRLSSAKTDNSKTKREKIETARKSEGNESSSSVHMDLDYSNELSIQDKVPVSQGDVKKKEYDNSLRRRETDYSSSVVASPKSNIGYEQEAMSLESQIDAENRERLKGMSADEISEAQAEIMEKMDPALLRLLKKRGEKKLKTQRSPVSDMGISVEPSNGHKDDKNEAVGLSVSEGPMAGLETNKASTDVQSEDGNGERRNPNPASGSLWKSWNARVEGARGLRFSLDGVVVGNDLVEVADTDRVAERDFLRTGGDPGAAGYTIKEAVALTRSVIPGQRAIALHVLFAVLDNAVQSICRGQVGCSMRNDDRDRTGTDWEAVWAYALGPEPELVLSLRICLDDNHYSVALACAKVIQCILTCDVNENYFDLSEKKTTLKDICTAPVFRSRPEIDVGFVRGGFWKYNAKSSNILTLDNDVIDDEAEGKHTIQDDIVVAGQDFSAGLVRMGILPRLRYLLESDPAAALEDCVVSILIAITRHSPNCADAVMKCQRLVETVVQRFTKKDITQIHPSMIKSIILIKVLARSNRKNCLEFLKNGMFFTMTMHLYKYTSSLDHWIKSGQENSKFFSALVVEQLRLWKVCVQHGYCVSYFSDVFPSLCLWLNPPSLEKLTENVVLGEFASISAEAYLVLETFATRLPNLFSQTHSSNLITENANDDMELWSWSHVGPMVDSALTWIAFMTDLHTCNFWQRGVRSGHNLQDSSVISLLWVYSAVLSMLAEVLKRIIPDDTANQTGSGGLIPWLPEFVPKIGLEIIKNKFLSFANDIGTTFASDIVADGSFIEKLCYLRQQNDHQASLASVCCLHRLIQTNVRIDNLIQLSKKGIQSSQEYSLSIEEKILRDGIVVGSLVELRSVQSIFMKLVASEWQLVQSIEIFGRGGPAPGVGVGWGARGGGYWSATVLLAEADAGLIVDLLECFQNLSMNKVPREEEITSVMQTINSSLAASLIAGPRERNIADKAFNILANISVLKVLDLCTRKFLHLNRRGKMFEWEYKEEDFLLFSKILNSHFSNRWLLVKKKKLKVADDTFKKSKGSLDTIHENLDTSNTFQDTSLAEEWAHQRLPLPIAWFLSPIATLCNSKDAGLRKSSNLENLIQDPVDLLEVANVGLFFLLGIEAMSSFLSSDVPSPVRCVPLVWKLHSLSVILLGGMTVIEENKSRDIYKALQDLYGDILDKARLKNAKMTCEENVDLLSETRNKKNMEMLRFQSEIHDSYSTFIETLVELFSAISYGDLIYGRQVAIYLHRCVEAPVRLAAWNALSNARVLELLPLLESCFGESEGYLQPIEDNADILEAYVKSWTSGALDRAATRLSASYTLVLHHLSYFIFHSGSGDKQMLRNKLARSLLRDLSQKQHHQVMMLNLLRYKKQATSDITNTEDTISPLDSSVDKRLEVLTEACERNSSLLNEVNKLKSLVQNSLS